MNIKEASTFYYDINQYLNRETINDKEYNLCLFFRLLNNTKDIVIIPWSLVNSLTYIDDINAPGLIGQISINNLNNVYSLIFDNIEQYALSFYIEDIQTGYNDSINFSASVVTPINNGEKNDVYNLIIQETFMELADNRAFLSTTALLSKTNVNFTFKDLTKFIVDISTTALPTSDASPNPTKLQNIIDVNDESFSKIGSGANIVTYILQNINSDTTGLEILQAINKLGYISDSATFENSSICTVRSENISFLNLSNKENYGHRAICCRTLNDICFNAFSQSRYVYETLVSVSCENKIIEGLTSIFISPVSLENITLYPVNRQLVKNYWCDFTINNSDTSDGFNAFIFKFKDIVQRFEEKYLGNQAICSIIIPKNISISPETTIFSTGTQQITSRGLANRPGQFPDKTYNYAEQCKVLRSIVTLNTMVHFTLPGNIFRKCNEMMYIDKDILKSNNSLADQSPYDNVLKSNNYYITKVIHNFKGQRYDNEIYATSFSS